MMFLSFEKIVDFNENIMKKNIIFTKKTYGKRYTFHLNHMEKGILFTKNIWKKVYFSLKTYGKYILKISGHPVLEQIW